MTFPGAYLVERIHFGGGQILPVSVGTASQAEGPQPVSLAPAPDMSDVPPNETHQTAGGVLAWDGAQITYERGNSDAALLVGASVVREVTLSNGQTISLTVEGTQALDPNAVGVLASFPADFGLVMCPATAFVRIPIKEVLSWNVARNTWNAALWPGAYVPDDARQQINVIVDVSPTGQVVERGRGALQRAREWSGYTDTEPMPITFVGLEQMPATGVAYVDHIGDRYVATSGDPYVMPTF